MGHGRSASDAQSPSRRIGRASCGFAGDVIAVNEFAACAAPKLPCYTPIASLKEMLVCARRNPLFSSLISALRSRARVRPMTKTAKRWAKNVASRWHAATARNEEQYLRDLFRVLPHWPKDRMLELGPKYWRQTRARLNENELAMPLGPLTVPPKEPPV